MSQLQLREEEGGGEGRGEGGQYLLTALVTLMTKLQIVKPSLAPTSACSCAICSSIDPSCSLSSPTSPSLTACSSRRCWRRVSCDSRSSPTDSDLPLRRSASRACLWAASSWEVKKVNPFQVTKHRNTSCDFLIVVIARKSLSSRQPEQNLAWE